MKQAYLGLVVISAMLIGCGGSSEPIVKNQTTEENSVFPAWYSSFGFTSDSTHFYGYGTAVSISQESAKSKAELRARALLESYIAKELEDIRSELERDGSSFVKQKDFIVKLRNAHYKIEEDAKLMQSTAKRSENIFRGFSEVKISKNKVKELVENGLGVSQNNTRAFINSPSFISLVNSSD